MMEFYLPSNKKLEAMSVINGDIEGYISNLRESVR